MKKILVFACFTILTTLGAYSQKEINKGKFSGYMFGDYYYNAARDTGITSMSNVANGGVKDLNGFQFRRIYFTYDYNISDVFSTRFRLEADQSANTSNGKIGVYVKDAYLQWNNIFEGSNLIFGIQPTPTFEVSEGIWGNRFLEKTIMDLRGIAPSRDISIALKGNIDKQGIFKYWLMYGNGSGNMPETDKYKRYYVNLQINPIKQLTATIYADLKARPDIKDPTNISNPQSTIANNDLTYAFFIGYKEKDSYTFGVEGFMNTRQNGIINGTDVKDKNGIGITAFVSCNLLKELELVGRYDYYDPNTNSDFKGDSRNWFLFSLNYKPDEKVTISPNFIIETYESLPNGRSFDASITPRITFFYIFL
jgi:hypothetical protein